MGRALSEPGTLVDLGHDVRDLHCSASRLDDVGWNFRNLAADRLVAGISHVDDSVLISKLLCVNCLCAGLKKLWPSDVGVQLEERGPTLRFLSSVLHAVEEEIYVFPWNPNVGFSLRLSDIQTVARL